MPIPRVDAHKSQSPELGSYYLKTRSYDPQFQSGRQRKMFWKSEMESLLELNSLQCKSLSTKNGIGRKWILKKK
jgi:hypothetical protein